MQNGSVVKSYSENVHGAKGKGQQGAKMVLTWRSNSRLIT